MRSKKSWPKLIWSGIQIIFAILFVGLMFTGCTYETYRWVTDIEYRNGTVITEIGQCEGGDSSNARCMARAGDVIVDATFPMLIGQTVYQRCFIETGGRNYCVNEWRQRRQGKPDFYGALEEYERGL